ncbi:c-type cytochrome [Lysobacter soyae]|uniref:Cytochrome c n=1 Tax=Lysobacter soyae TaxID=2764185 RepID=A0ABX8WSG5_9GAMM|nr:cytochrome c [Lysobacter sp. CJ11]QYR53771.1 cytochrome c [Lysobacter sp. CJ11]
MIAKRIQVACFIAFASLGLAACGSGNKDATAESHAEQKDEAAEKSHEAAQENISSRSLASLPSPNMAAGKEIAETKCVTCHGPGGAKPVNNLTPRLAGQYGDYLAHSMIMYRDGERDHAIMSLQAKELTDQQISDLAAYFSSQPGQLGDLANQH